MRSKRRRSVGPLGTRILVCGHSVSAAHGLICILSPTIVHTTHTAVAVNDDNNVILAFREAGGDVEWQLVGDQPELFTSRKPR